MQYGQIVFILFIILLLYYAGMIVMDLQQARAAKAAELDNQSEEDIDISDEAKSFKTIQVTRDDPKKKEKNQVGHDRPEDTPANNEKIDTPPDNVGEETETADVGDKTALEEKSEGTSTAGGNDETDHTDKNDTAETDESGTDSPEEAEDKEEMKNEEKAESGEDVPSEDNEPSETVDEPAASVETEEAPTELSVRRPGYREPVMAGSISVEDLIKDVDKLALTGISDLGAIVFSIETME